MSLFRTLLATMAAVAIASPVFADDYSTQTQPSDNNATMSNQQTSSNTSATDEKIDLNKATAKELMKVKGINAAKARAIVAYRKKHPFTSTEDLLKVKGFKKLKPETLRAIQERVTVE